MFFNSHKKNIINQNFKENNRIEYIYKKIIKIMMLKLIYDLKIINFVLVKIKLNTL